MHPDVVPALCFHKFFGAIHSKTHLSCCSKRFWLKIEFRVRGFQVNWYSLQLSTASIKLKMFRKQLKAFERKTMYSSQKNTRNTHVINLRSLTVAWVKLKKKLLKWFINKRFPSFTLFKFQNCKQIMQGCKKVPRKDFQYSVGFSPAEY